VIGIQPGDNNHPVLLHKFEIIVSKEDYKMYHTQKGCLPFMLATISGLLFIGFITVCLSSIIQDWNNAQILYPMNEAVRELFFSFAIYLGIFIVIILPLVGILGGMFPAIRVTKRGLKYSFLGFGGGLLLWEEIENILDLKNPKNCKAILISRKGFFLFNGLWPNTMYGIFFIGHIEPILLISSGIQDREKLLRDIRAHIDIRALC
jgi:hypothetical protein